MVSFFVLLLLATAVAPGEQFTFTFLPGKGASKAPGFLRLEEGPCGNLAIARVSKMPRYSANAALVPDEVFEVSASGSLIRRWSTPVGALPVGMNGTRLLFATGELRLWVRPDGTLARLRKSEKTGRLESENYHEQCPQVKAFSGSAYVGCLIFRDPVSGAKRTLVFQHPCT